MPFATFNNKAAFRVYVLPRPPLPCTCPSLGAHITIVLPSCFFLPSFCALPCHASLICMRFVTPPTTPSPPSLSHTARLCHFQFCILIIKFCLAKCKIRNRKKRKQQRQRQQQQVQLVADGQTFCDGDAGRGTHDYFVDDDNPGWQLCLLPAAFLRLIGLCFLWCLLLLLFAPQSMQ